ncbi:MAG: YjbH domain-containing protein [Candidatus Eisenbacteria bacterium]|nr:YjbH domain-containing protein [Candidatus Eisenbacteria bacterium]
MSRKPGLMIAVVLLHLLAHPSGHAQDVKHQEFVDSLAGAGFENISVSFLNGGDVEIRFENRIERWELRALGRVAGRAIPYLSPGGALALTPLTRGVATQTLKAPVEAWRQFLSGAMDLSAFREILHISEPGSWPPIGTTLDRDSEESGLKPLNASQWRIDLALRPLVDLQLGIADDPFQTGFWVAPELTMSPAGSLLLTLQARIELQDDLDDFNSPIEPGRNTLSWNNRLPGGIHAAASGGTFPENRYGFVAEAGRYLDRRGLLEARVGGDWSGFFKFLDAGTVSYSDIAAWSGVGTLIGRLPGRDVEVSFAAGHFLSGDEGIRIDAVRRFGEVDLGFFGISTDAGEVGGFRFSVPLPARHLSRPAPIRATTVPSFPFEYREDVAPIGQRVRAFDTIDRFRHGLTPTYIENNLDAIRGRSVTSRYRDRSRAGWPIIEPRASLAGTTGLINTPTPHVALEGTIHVGYSHIPREFAYEGRGSLRNEYGYLTVGFLPWVEASLRATVLPGEYLIEDVPVDAVDRMGSLRIQSPWPGGRTTLGAGVEDIRGTRRFHSLYLVASQSIGPGFDRPGAEVTLGYGLRSLTAARYLLDGVFGGVQLQLTPWAITMAEYDSEKWNGGVRVIMLSRLSAQLALLNFEELSGGVSWSVRF